MAAHRPVNLLRISRTGIWLSELSGAVLVCLIIGALTYFGLTIYSRERTISRNERTILSLQMRTRMLKRTSEQGAELATIHGMLASLSRQRLSDTTLHQLTWQIFRTSKTYGYDPALLLAVIHVESVFRVDALGRYRSGTYSGARGLMQLKFETAREVAHDLGIELRDEDDLFIPEVNVALGTAYLTQLIALFKDVHLGILAYNQGPGAIMQSLAGKRPLSRNYLEKVLSTYYRLKGPSAS